MSARRFLPYAALVFCGIATAMAFQIPEPAFSGLKWRLIGPMRAGWSTCAAGDPSAPETFYFGAADGGIWKTADAGLTWASLFDDAAVASIGALEIAPSDAQIIYAGTGQPEPRYDVAAGNGIYRSRDGGRTWEHMGLADSRHIGRIIVDPRNPDTVIVAALGHIFGPNPERGVFRTTDGGKNWQKVLFKDENTGAVDLACDLANPDVMYAALWQMRCHPWQSYFTPLAGPGSGIYRSVDGGRNWGPVSTRGLPKGPYGRIGLAARGARVYAAISAETGAGLYRSDDGGENWQQLSDDASLADWYFARLTIDPRNPDIVYVMGRSVRRSTDGGRTFTITKGAPGGDDYHFLWVNPKDPRRMILASDQGTTITLNGGDSWSSWYHQPTGQFYHVATDERFPYWIYSGQQDSGTVAVASRSDYGQLSYRDWHPVGGDERDYDIPDPANPDIVYGSGLGGRLSRWDARTGQVQNVSPWPVSSYGARPTTVRYRYDWITPLAISRQEPHALYFGAQVLFRSYDGGQHWETISRDLTGAIEGAKDCDGAVPVERARACGFGIIFTIGLSPINKDVIWVGTDNGLIQLTRDGGKNWQNVTPPGLPDWSKVAQIDPSAGDPATAFAAIDRHRLDDYGPHAYRTHDYGKTWTEISRGLPREAYVNVVRQDPTRPSLLFAGTSRGVLVSFSDGDDWQPLQLNLPTSGVNDLAIHGNDLVAATQGRALWVLDDISPLRHMPAAGIGAEANLFPPAPAVRLIQNQNKDTPLPPEEPTAPNPPEGAILDYYLAHAPAGALTLEIFDAAGKLVQKFQSDQVPPKPDAEQYFADRWLTPRAVLPARPGHNRFAWNLRYPRPPALQYEYSIAAVAGSTEALPAGALVLPGRYEVRLKVDGRTYQQPLTVQLDPRVKVSASSLAAQLAFERQTADLMARSTSSSREIAGIFKRLAETRGKVQGRQDLATVVSTMQSMTEELDRFQNGTSPDNIAEIGAALTGLETDVEGTDQAPTAAQREVLQTYGSRLETATAHWKQLKSGPLSELDRKIQAAGFPSVLVK